VNRHPVACLGVQSDVSGWIEQFPRCAQFLKRFPLPRLLRRQLQCNLNCNLSINVIMITTAPKMKEDFDSSLIMLSS
jgi:hypothetical protein